MSIPNGREVERFDDNVEATPVGQTITLGLDGLKPPTPGGRPVHASRPRRPAHPFDAARLPRGGLFGKDAAGEAPAGGAQVVIDLGRLPQEEMFGGLVASQPRKMKRGFWWNASIVTHVGIVLIIALAPLLLSDPLPQPKAVHIVSINPPPPPPPPLPKSSSLVQKDRTPKQTRPDTTITETTFTAYIENPEEVELLAEDLPEELEAFGDIDGSIFGVPGGMKEGVDGGVMGGIPGGVVGGCVGCTGDGPVMDYDSAPVPIRMTQPVYPQDAFVKKIEGTVLVEIYIDIHGNVVSARIIQSIPALDAAAIATVKQWRFKPARKGGKPVPTMAHAPVGFRIY